MGTNFIDLCSVTARKLCLRSLFVTQSVHCLTLISKFIVPNTMYVQKLLSSPMPISKIAVKNAINNQETSNYRTMKYKFCFGMRFEHTMCDSYRLQKQLFPPLLFFFVPIANFSSCRKIIRINFARDKFYAKSIKVQNETAQAAHTHTGSPYHDTTFMFHGFSAIKSTN